MKLIIREYLASLRERNELDALLPDLLSQMGLDVYSKPGVGGRQYGVDIAAYGRIDDGPETVYLFSVKSGNLGRADWNSGREQDLQPSLDEIREAYIKTHLPAKYKDKPIEICLCFGGDLKEVVRLNVTQYENTYTTEQISFSEWNGETIASYIDKHLLREELLPKKSRQLLRKSLALLDEPDTSYKHFKKLVKLLSTEEFKKDEDILTAIRQLYLSLWILYAWCREEDNLESAYLASELTLLHAWEMGKPFFGKSKKINKAVLGTLTSIETLHYQISTNYIDTKIVPNVGKLHALSSAIHPSCTVDVNLKIFDTLGRLALSGLWSYWYFSKIPQSEENSEILKGAWKSIEEYKTAIMELIINNPMLCTPYKDEQAIDITLATFFLMLDQKNDTFIHSWLNELTNRIHYLFSTDNNYPCNLQGYHNLIEHPQQNNKAYLEDATVGSILYPMISLFSGLLEFDDIYYEVKNIKNTFLKHCNFQVWYPDIESEKNFYNNESIHGATLSNVNIDADKEAFINELFKECDESKYFNELSAIRIQHWPLILIACRHYRLPVPVHFF